MFTTSPLLGRWSDTRRLGDIILSRQKTLDDFHQAALQRPELPDYEVLYRLAADQASVPYSAGDTSHLMWTVYAIREFRIRLVSVESSDPMKAEQVCRLLASACAERVLMVVDRFVSRLIANGSRRRSAMTPACSAMVPLDRCCPRRK